MIFAVKMIATTDKGEGEACIETCATGAPHSSDTQAGRQAGGYYFCVVSIGLYIFTGCRLVRIRDAPPIVGLF